MLACSQTCPLQTMFKLAIKLNLYRSCFRPLKPFLLTSDDVSVRSHSYWLKLFLLTTDDAPACHSCQMVKPFLLTTDDAPAHSHSCQSLTMFQSADHFTAPRQSCWLPITFQLTAVPVDHWRHSGLQPNWFPLLTTFLLTQSFADHICLSGDHQSTIQTVLIRASIIKSLIFIVKTCQLPPLILSRWESIIRWPEVNKRPNWFMWECKKDGCKKASPYAECDSLSSLFLTMVAELKDTMASKYFPPPVLLKDKYNTWKKEMKIWELVISLDKTKRALMVEGTAREAVLELDTAVLNSENGMKKLYEKLDTLFLEDVNQSAFQAYETFENYQRPPGTSLEYFLIWFGRLVAKLKDFNILLPEPVLAFRTLKSTNITEDNEKLVKATVSELMLSSMSEQLRKIMRGHSSSDSSPNTSPVMVKNEMDIVNYAGNNQMDPTEVYCGRSSYRRDLHFNNSREKINCAGRRQGYKNKTRSTNKKKLNPRDRTGNITVCFNCGCRFHWSYDCPNLHSSRNKDGVEIEEDFSVAHVVLMSQQKRKFGGNIFLGETLGSVVLDSGSSSTVCGTKWYKCFLETLTDAQKKKIIKNKGVRTF